MNSSNYYWSTLLQILARRIIFDTNGEMVDYELISPIVHFRSILQNLSAPASGDGSSEHVRLGVSISQTPQQMMLRGFSLC